MASGPPSRGPATPWSWPDTPVFDELWERYPHSTLTTWGPLVGLPEGQMGNSEVGHMNLGAGGVVKQEITRIDEAVEGGSFFDNEVLSGVPPAAPSGPPSPARPRVGGRRAREHESPQGCLELAAREDVPDVVLHAFTDGRDTHPDAGAGYVAEVEGWMRELGSGQVGSVSGRYYAMDRDRRWDRIKLAWEAIVHGRAEPPPADSGRCRPRRLRARRDRRVHQADPRRRRGPDPRRRRRALLQLRPDRARELTRALGGSDFAEFDRGDAPTVSLTTLTRYQEEWTYPIAFPPARPEITLARVLADHGMAQLHVAETEKYAHVTYFFNGGEEEPHEEERYLVDSPPRRTHLRPRAGDVGPRGGRTPSSSTGAGETTASGSSTSPTRTWSATPG